MGWINMEVRHESTIRAKDVLLEDVDENILVKGSLSKKVIHVSIKLDSVKMSRLNVNQQWFIKFEFGDKIYTAQTRTTGKKETEPKFDLSWKFETDIMIEDLQDTFLKINLMPISNKNNSTEPLSTIMIDFFTLAFGPVWHVLKFKSNRGRSTIGILQYNIIFEQISDCTVSLTNLNIKVDNIENMKIQTNFRWVTPIHKIESTWEEERPSAKFNTSLENMSLSSLQIRIWRDNKDLKPIQLLKTIITKNLEAVVKGSNASFAVDDKDKEDSEPSEFQDSEEEESKEHLNSHNTQPNNGKTQEDSKVEESEPSSPTSADDHPEDNYVLIGEWYISFIRLVEEQIIMFDTTTNDANKSLKSFKKMSTKDLNDPEIVRKMITHPEKSVEDYKIWNWGSQVGTISAVVKFEDMPFLRQKQVGVLTEEGIKFSSIVDPQYNKAGLPKTMIQVFEDFKIVRKRDTKRNGQKDVKLGDANKKLISIANLLKESIKTSTYIYEYDSKAAKIKGQEILIDLGTHCISFVDTSHFDIKAHYYEILIGLFRRGELDLTQIGFTDIQNEKDKQSKQELKKKETGTKYQEFIYKSLQYWIDKLSRKAEDFYKRDFICLGIAICYFRVPEFRNAFISAISKRDICEITEWSDGYWNINEQPFMPDEESDDLTIDHFFNWKKYFYDEIKELPQYQDNLRILASLMGMKRWEERIEKRGVAFFLIVSKWAEYVSATIVKNQFLWKNIPGYATILRVTLHEMKTRMISEYPESLIEATCKLLANEKIISVFMDILFMKTNIHSSVDVKKTLDIVDSWFQVLGSDGKKFPANFDFNFFFKAIDLLMDYDHSISTPKVIWLIYRIFHIVPLEEQLILSEKLFKHRFMDLFLSWSWNIRTVYYKLLLYQLRTMYGSYSVGGQGHFPFGDPKSKNLNAPSANKKRRVVRGSFVNNDHSITRNFQESIDKQDLIVVNKITSLIYDVERKVEKIVDSVEPDILLEDFKIDKTEEEKNSGDYDASMLEYNGENGRNKPRASNIPIPTKNKPYLAEAVKDYKKELEEYLKWIEQGKSLLVKYFL